MSAIVEGISLALYRFTEYKSSAGADNKDIDTVEFWSSAALPETAIAHGTAIAAGVALLIDPLVTAVSRVLPRW